MDFKTKSFITLVATVCLNTNMAEANSFDYFGASYQYTQFNELAFSPDFDPTIANNYAFDDKKSGDGLRLFAGHHFNRFVAIEAGISNVATADFVYSSRATDGTKTTVHSGSFSTLSADFRVIGTYSLTQSWFLKAQLGALAWDNKWTYLTGSADNSTTETSQKSGVSPLVAFGLAYSFSKNTSASLDIEKTEINDQTAETLGIALFFKF